MPAGPSSSDGRARGAASWAAWWDGNDVLADDESRRDAQAFVEATDPIVSYRADDDVLDVGCGGGFVLEELAPRVRSAVGVEVAPRLVAAARARCASRSNVEVLPLDPADSTDLSALGERRFSVVLCNSVVQYLLDGAEADALLRSIARHVVPGARVLVSDLVVGGGRSSDVLGLLRGTLRRGRVMEAWRRIRRLRRSTYGTTRARLGLLAVDPERLATVARALGGAPQVLAEPLTMLANRRHLFVRW